MLRNKRRKFLSIHKKAPHAKEKNELAAGLLLRSESTPTNKNKKPKKKTIQPFLLNQTPSPFFSQKTSKKELGELLERKFCPPFRCRRFPHPPNPWGGTSPVLRKVFAAKLAQSSSSDFRKSAAWRDPPPGSKPDPVRKNRFFGEVGSSRKDEWLVIFWRSFPQNEQKMKSGLG